MIEYKWENITCEGDLPVTRSSHDVSYINGIVYVFGGENIARTPIDSDLKCLNLETSTWSTIPCVNGPACRVAHAQAAVGDQLYIFGGRQGIQVSELPLNDLWRFDTICNSWTLITPFNDAPPARSFHKMIANGHSLYVFGGCAEVGRLNDLHEYNICTNTWTALKVSSNISGRGGPSIFYHNDSIFVATGYSGQENDDVHVYNINTCEWKETVKCGSAIYRARSVCASCILDSNKLIIFGGEVSTSDKGHEGAGDFADDLVAVNATSGDVLQTVLLPVSHKPIARGWTSMCAISATEAILFGGLSGNDDAPVRLNDVWKLTIISV